MDIDGLISKLRRSRDFIVRAAPACAEALGDAVRATANAGTAPDGTAWAPRVRDGQRALPDAASAISEGSVGTKIYVRISGSYALHDAGQGHAIARKILPTNGEIPPRALAAIKQALVDEWSGS